MNSKKGRESGFTLVELAVAVGIALVIAAMAVPGLTNTIETYRLDASGHATSALLVQTRLQAVRNNVPAYTQYDTTKTPNMVYVTSDPATAYSVGLPDVEIASASFTSTNVPDHTQLDAYLSNGNPGVTAEIGTVIGFNARGLPCMEGASAAVCQQQDPVTNNTPYFEWFMVDSRGGWEAVTVTPAGRVKAWRKVASTGCGYPVCWE